MTLLDIDDAQLRYDHMPRPGSPALLILNSLGTSLEAWDAQAATLGQRFELVRYDARGHGRSTLGSANELTIDRLARDALAVLDACGIARAHLCGLSLGGMTAMHIARHWPDRVLKLVLANTSPHMPPKQAWQARIETVQRQGMPALVEAVLERWFTPEYRYSQPGQVERIRQMLLATDPRGYAACSAAIRDMDQREDIKSIDVTTLVIGGSKDPATPPAHADLIAGSIKGARLVMLESAHLSNIECAQQFDAAVLEFLTGQSP